MPSDSSTPPGSAAGDPPLHLLSRFERTSFRFIDRLIRKHLRLTELYNHTIGVGYVSVGSGRMIKTFGMERLAGLSQSDGILLVSNHRSFFDLYELGMVLYKRSHLQQAVICPVRSNFFYERPLGVVVNLLAGGGHMYPPFFRDPAKADFNRWSLARTAEMLQAGNVIVGFHPEGKRNKNESPYEPLPAQPGVGKLVMDSWPIVVPAFINGMSQDFLGDIKNNFVGKRVAIAVFGEPLDLSRFRSMSSRLASHKRIADFLLERIYALGEEERRQRAALEA